MDIRVKENNSPTLHFKLKERAVGSSDTFPYIIAGAVIELYVKNKKADPDASPRFKYASNGASPKISILLTGEEEFAEVSQVAIACVATDMTPPGEYPYHLDAVIGASRQTVVAGFWIIEDI